MMLGKVWCLKFRKMTCIAHDENSVWTNNEELHSYFQISHSPTNACKCEVFSAFETRRSAKVTLSRVEDTYISRIPFGTCLPNSQLIPVVNIGSGDTNRSDGCCQQEIFKQKLYVESNHTTIQGQSSQPIMDCKRRAFINAEGNVTDKDFVKVGWRIWKLSPGHPNRSDFSHRPATWPVRFKSWARCRIWKAKFHPTEPLTLRPSWPPLFPSHEATYEILALVSITLKI